MTLIFELYIFNKLNMTVMSFMLDPGTVQCAIHSVKANNALCLRRLNFKWLPNVH